MALPPPPPTPTPLHRGLSPGEGEEIPLGLHHGVDSAASMKNMMSAELAAAAHRAQYQCESEYPARKLGRRVLVSTALVFGCALLIVVVVAVVYNSTNINELFIRMHRYHPETSTGRPVQQVADSHNEFYAYRGMQAAQHQGELTTPASHGSHGSGGEPILFHQLGNPAPKAIATIHAPPFDLTLKPKDGHNVLHGQYGSVQGDINIDGLAEIVAPRLNKRSVGESREDREGLATAHKLAGMHFSLLKEAEDIKQLMQDLERDIRAHQEDEQLNVLSPGDILTDGYPMNTDNSGAPRARRERVRRSDKKKGLDVNLITTLKQERARLLKEAADIANLIEFYRRQSEGAAVTMPTLNPTMSSIIAHAERQANALQPRKKRDAPFRSVRLRPKSKREARAEAIKELLEQRTELFSEISQIDAIIEKYNEHEKQPVVLSRETVRAKRDVDPQRMSNEVDARGLLKKNKRRNTVTKLYIDSVRRKKHVEPYVMKKLVEMRENLLKEAAEIMAVVEALEREAAAEKSAEELGDGNKSSGSKLGGQKERTSSQYLDIWPTTIIPIVSYPDLNADAERYASMSRVAIVSPLPADRARAANESVTSTPALIRFNASLEARPKPKEELITQHSAESTAWKVNSTGGTDDMPYAQHPEHAGRNESAHRSRYAEEDPGCPPGHRACHDYSGCVVASMWCDGEVNCPDSSDEAHCSCRDRVERDRLCDGYFDCPAGEDELGCLGCLPTEFSCNDLSRPHQRSTCVPIVRRCDGIQDCPNGKDESECSLLTLTVTGKKSLPVSYQHGFLHRNYHGEWFPVCRGDGDHAWALQACKDVVSPSCSEVGVDRVGAPVYYRGPWVVAMGTEARVVASCSAATVVTCPPILPGSRVPPPQETARSSQSEYDWDPDSSEENDPEDLRARLKRYLRLPPGADPVIVGYDQVDQLAERLEEQQEAMRHRERQRAAEEGEDSDYPDWNRNGKAYRVKETLQDEDGIVQDNTEENVAFSVDPEMARRLVDEIGSSDGPADRIFLHRLPSGKDMYQLVDDAPMRSSSYQGYPRAQSPRQQVRHRRAVPRGPEERTRREARVVGGRPAKAGAWPWVVALYRDGIFHCGGVILDSDWVMTAAHCVNGFEHHYLEVQAGMLRRFSFSPMEQTRGVDYVVMHEEYDPEDMRNDVALVRVSQPLNMNRWVRPVALADWGVSLGPADPPPGTLCTAVGWGATVEHGPDPDHMREVRVPVLPACVHPEDRKAGGLCAGNLEGGRDACQGDSGGPLLCRVPFDQSRWYAAGVVSHGEGCARPGEPGAYTRVSRYIHWIQEQMLQASRAQLGQVGQPGHTPLLSCPGHQCRSGPQRCVAHRKRCDRAVDCLKAEDELGCDWRLDEFLRSASVPLTPYSRPRNFTTSSARESEDTAPVEAPPAAAADVVFPLEVTPTPASPEAAGAPEVPQQPQESQVPQEPQVPEEPAPESAPPAAPTRGDTLPDEEEPTPAAPTASPAPADNSTAAATDPSGPVSVAVNSSVTYPDIKANLSGVPGVNVTVSGSTLNANWSANATAGVQASTSPLDGAAGTAAGTVAPAEAAAAGNGTAYVAPTIAGSVNETADSTGGGTSNVAPTASPTVDKTADSTGNGTAYAAPTIPSTANGTAESVTNGTSYNAPAAASAANDTSGAAAAPASPETTPLPTTTTPLPDTTTTEAPDARAPAVIVTEAPAEPTTTPTVILTTTPSPVIPQFTPTTQTPPDGDMFHCTRTPQVVPMSRRCDRAVDCADGTDEEACKCRDYLATSHPHAVCDGVLDCLDGTDEEGCVLCPLDKYRCWQSPGNKCIPAGLECDGKEDCPGGEDEAFCLALVTGSGRLQVDAQGLPMVQQEGVVARKVHGVWRTLCSGLHGSSRSVTSWAADTCVALGFSGWESYNNTPVEDKALFLSSPRVIPLDGPMTIREDSFNTIAGSSLFPGVLGAECSGLRVKCAPGVDGSPDRFMLAPGLYAWPWHAEVFVEGNPICSGVLVSDSWVISSKECIKDIDPARLYVSVLLGGARSELGVTGPHEQARRVDGLQRVPSTSAVLLHLERPAIRTRHVRPSGLPDWFAMVKKALSCVAVGRAADGAWLSVALKHQVSCPEGASLGKTCFQGPLHQDVCAAYARNKPWSGAVVCRAKSGWHPAAVFHVPDQCALAGSVSFDAVHFMLRQIRNIIDGETPAILTPAPFCGGLRCPVGQCLPPSAVCDGAANCRWAVDESVTMCEPRRRSCDSGGKDCVCRPDEVRCATGGCVSQRAWCDGRRDCPDGSDEPANCTCAAFLLQARPALVCDGRRQCLDRSDEDPAVCLCTPDRFTCPRSKRCISPEEVCDGNPDCPDGEDEQACFSVDRQVTDYAGRSGLAVVIRRSYGAWHSYCGPAPSAPQLDAACASAGFSRAAPATTHALNASLVVLPAYDAFSEARLNRRSQVTLRGAGALVTLRNVQLPPGQVCTQTAIVCQ